MGYFCSLYFTLNNKSQFLSSFALKHEVFINPTEMASLPQMRDALLHVPHNRFSHSSNGFLSNAPSDRWDSCAVLSLWGPMTMKHEMAPFQASEWKTGKRQSYWGSFPAERKFWMINIVPDKNRYNRCYQRLFSLQKHGICRVQKVFSFPLVNFFSRAGLSPITELFRQSS